MLAKTITHRQRYWLKYVEAADISDGTIADYATASDYTVQQRQALRRLDQNHCLIRFEHG